MFTTVTHFIVHRWFMICRPKPATSGNPFHKKSCSALARLTDTRLLFEIIIINNKALKGLSVARTFKVVTDIFVQGVQKY